MNKKEFSPIYTKNKNILLLYIFVTISFIIPIFYIICRMIMNDVPTADVSYHSNPDYALMLVQCILGLFAINIPSILSRRFCFEVPLLLYGLYIVFLYCAIFLGEVRRFYYTVPFWDSILHCMSSIMTGLFAFMLVTILNRNEKTVFTLSRGFVALFAFCFSMAIGALWEIYEFVFDGILGLNMQKFLTGEGVPLVGRDALADTMSDIIVDLIGALVATLLGYLAIKADKQWIIPSLSVENKQSEKE